jgi:predicted transcriptional regulator
MRAVLMSMKPQWWEKILAGEKTMEIRKSAPNSEDGRKFTWPLTVLVYVSGTGAVQGQFTCHGWIKTNLLDMMVAQSCVPLEDLQEYARGGSLCGWVVGSPEKYDTPSPLAEFGLDRPPMSWQYVEIPDAAEV